MAPNTAALDQVSILEGVPLNRSQALSPARSRLPWLLSLLALLASRPAAADPVTLADSTTIESWRLANGLQVVTRHLPRAKAIALTVCYRAGSALDPPGHEGLGALLAELDFTAAAGDVPDRTRAEMASLRPFGWGVKVTRRFALLSEGAGLERFPGVLHQAALRMRGVTVSEANLRDAVVNVKRDLAENYAQRPDRELYYAIGDLAAGANEAAVRRYGNGHGLDGMTVKEVQRKLASIYVPANAVLSILGNLDGLDLHRLVENEFGAIPSGTPLPPPAAAGLQRS